MFRRRRLFFQIARIVAMFVIGLAVAVFIALSQVNLETLRSDLLDILRDSTDMHVEIDGNVSWKFSLRPRVELNKVRVPNESWAKNKNGFTAEKIDVTLNLISLLRDRPTIQSVRIYKAEFFAEENDKGESSLMRSKNEHTDEKKEETSAPKTELYPFKDPGLGSVEINDFKIHAKQSVYEISGINLSSSQNKDGREYSGWLKLDSKVYPFIMNFSEYNETRKVYPVRVALSTGGEALVANLALEGKSKMPIDFIIKGNIPDISGLGKIIGYEIPKLPMIKLNLAGGFGHKSLTLRKSSVAIRDSEMTISGNVDWSGATPKITADIKSKKIDLNEVFPNLYGSGVQWVHPNRDLNVFKDTPLYGKEFLGRNISITANIDNLLVYRDMVIKSLDLKAAVKNNKVRIDAKTKFAEGDVTAGVTATIDADGTIHARAAGLGERVYVGEIMDSVREYDYISELPTNFEFYLVGSGADLSELIASTWGPIYVYSVAPGYAHSELITYMYGTDFLTDLRHSIRDIFTSNKKASQIKISCAAVNLKVRNGKVDTEHGVAVETNAINLRLAGDVDFGKENMKLSLITVPVRGIKLSLTGNVVNAIEFSGNLAEPDIKINGSAFVGKVASATGIGLLLAPFTGGLGLVAGAGVGWLAGDLLENWLADDHPCQTAMDQGAPTRRDDPEWMKQPMATLVSEIIK